MTKHKLLLEEEFDFELIGICSSHSDYRLSWSINNALKIKLTKEEDYSIVEKKEGEHLHSYYEYYDDDEHIEYYLIKNVSHNYQRLIPEKDQIDFFLIIKNNFALEINDVLERLKALENISTAFIFNPNDLKSKSNLEF